MDWGYEFSRIWREWGRGLTYIALPAVLMVALWVAFSHMEARAFNRVTGESVTTWDAMFIELRVQEGSSD